MWVAPESDCTILNGASIAGGKLGSVSFVIIRRPPYGRRVQRIGLALWPQSCAGHGREDSLVVEPSKHGVADDAQLESLPECRNV